MGMVPDRPGVEPPVDDVGAAAHHVADGDLSIAAQHGDDGGSHFRQRGAKGHQREPDHDFRDAQGARQFRRGSHQPLCPEYETAQPDDDA